MPENAGQSIISRITLEVLLYLRTFVSTPIIITYGIVLILVGTTLTSTFTGNVDIVPLVAQKFFPDTFNLHLGSIFQAWWIISLVLHLIQKIIKFIFNIELSVSYFKRIKLYYLSLIVLMLFVVVASLFRLGWFKTLDTSMSYMLIVVAISGLSAVSISWAATAYVDLFIWALDEGLRQQENPDRPIPRYAWPFKRRGIVEKIVLNRIGMTEEDFDEAERTKEERLQRLEEITGRKVDSEEKEL